MLSTVMVPEHAADELFGTWNSHWMAVSFVGSTSAVGSPAVSGVLVKGTLVDELTRN